MITSTDTIVELAGGGYDTIVLNDGRSITLAANVERLVASGSISFSSGVFTITGNDLDNVIDLTSLARPTLLVTLDGGAGADHDRHVQQRRSIHRR